MFKEIFKITINHIFDWIILFCSVVVPIIITCFGLPQSEIKEKVYLIIIFILITLILYSIKLFINMLTIVDTKKFKLPKLKIIKDNYYIFEPSELYSSQMLVSLYYSGNDLEKLIGYGIIETVISQTKNLQVRIIKFEGENINNSYCLSNKDNIILKPSVPYDLIQGITIKKENENG